ncbi:MAG: M20 family metallopeptidase [Ruminococcus sp.]|jgi:succinyl-diaminopimelate desuccinylase|nr:M20 family metallopeptidase [Ruminococcus sp.]
MTENEKKVLALIDENEIVEFMKTLINVRSDYPKSDTRQISEICLEKFREYHMDCELAIPPETVKNPKDNHPSCWYPSVIAKIPGQEEGPVLLLNAHMDTVSAGNPSEWETDPFQAYYRNGNIYGRGAGDDKGSVCAQIMAATIIKRSGIPLKGTLLINPVSDEEANSCRGAKWLRDSEAFKPDMAIIGEQTNNKIAIAERAVVFVKISITGKGCHGAMPWAGSNATVHMSDFIQVLQRELIPEVEKTVHPYLPLTTLSATHIEGGVQVNIIPETCMLEIDCRLTPGVNEDYILKRFDEILQILSDNSEKFQYSIEVTNSEKGVVVDTNPDELLVREMAEAYQQIKGEKTEFTGYRQASDGRVFAKWQIPIAIFGPGDPALGHAPNEFVPVDQLVDATKILTLTILKLLS